MSAAVLLFARRVAITILAAVANALAARWLGVRDFGDLSTALAVYYLLVAIGDFGFSLVLGRALAADPADRATVVRSAAWLQVGLTTALSVGAVAYGWLVWGSDLRFQTLVVLVPALFLSGLAGYRQVFVVLHRVRTMASLDLATAFAQTGAVIAAAALSLGPVGVAAAMSLASVANSLIGAVLASRLVGAARSTRTATLAVLREAGPLGLMSVLATAYFTVDMIVLGWIADAVSIGYYAAAVKVLSILVSLPGIVMTAMLPAVARARGDVGEIATPVWHLLVSTVVPACLVIGLSAPVVVQLLYGYEFAPAATILTVLALAGVLATLSNLVGTLLVAQRRGVVLALQNLVLLVLNVVLNLMLVPRYGVIASAWTTAITELLVVVAALVVLGRGAIGHIWAWARVSAWPMLVAVPSLAGPVVIFGRESAVAVAVGLTLFLLAMTVFRVWPPALVALVRRQAVPA